MKFSTIINASLMLAVTSGPSTSAFFLSNSGIQGQWRKEAPSAVRKQTRVDTSDLIEEALTASKTYGASSPEARLAWDVVEEIDAMDNNAATLGIAPENQEEIQALNARLEQHQPTMITLENIPAEIKPIKLSTTKTTTPKEDSDKLKEALKNARQQTQDFGIHSSEAKIAWETVEELSSSDRSENAMGGMLTPEECSVDASSGDACEAMEELNRVLHMRLHGI
ncbi:MAG: hypothetical protein SGBAC_000841 [Bacillariaceae sp.]